MSLGRLACCALAAFVFVAIASPHSAHAEAVVLVDGSTVTGKLLHYYDGVMTLVLPSGQRLRLPASKVKRVRFKMPAPRKALGTPRKAFKRLRRAALRGDLRTYVDAHATPYQMLLQHQISIASPKKFMAQLKKQWGAAQLEVVGTKVKGHMARLVVRRRAGARSAKGSVHFIRENREWKMVLPL